MEATLVTATIKEETLRNLEAFIDEIAKGNVVSLSTVASLAGRGNHIASLVWALRPFSQQLWAALRSDCSSSAPPGCIWLKQIAGAVRWIKAFLVGSQGTLQRRFHLAKHFRVGGTVNLLLDASPWGFGGVLVYDGRPMAWFSDAISAQDVTLFRYNIGESAGQQCWESLAALMALRAWARYWQHGRTTLMVTGDSVAMLTLVIKMKPHSGSRAMGIIARELALDMADAVYEPDVVQHTPGTANVTPDLLSRRFDPRYKTWAVPYTLVDVPETIMPERNLRYYRSLAVP